MDPFNIILDVQGEQIDLNIHPQREGAYKIIYHGMLLGEIFLESDGQVWEAVTAQALQPVGFPVYENDETSAYQHILLDGEIVQHIGRAIPR